MEAWTHRYGSWIRDLKKRIDAGQNVSNETLEGAALLEEMGLADDAKLLRTSTDVWNTARHPDLVGRVAKAQPRDDLVRSETEYPIQVGIPKAHVGAWYEMFPRSQGETPGQHATLGEAARRLPDIRRMGFDIVYLPPIHPVGRTARKGLNNSLVAGPDDPGSPWAIGNEHGGHDGVDPALGGLSAFKEFVTACRENGLDIALDFAIQCSPDHPWVKDHPEWFYRRPDGTIKFAENPPKKYEDIYPLNFDTPDRKGLLKEIRRIFEVWIGRGVNIFRVDNPHTKPPSFWEWLITDITSSHPDVIFLAEAFTRPAMMDTLAKVGFTQSYTYFTWRNTKKELTEYLADLTRPGKVDWFIPNLWVNTPDILPDILVEGGAPAFRMRLVLAATLAGSYGIYSGYELCENEAMPHHASAGELEYADSEKYQVRVRDCDGPGNIKDLVIKINRIRRENGALRQLPNLRFLECGNDQILCYARWTDDRSNLILVIVNLDPKQAQEGRVEVPLEELELAGEYEVQDLLAGSRYSWGGDNYVRLDPETQPAHIFRVERHG